MSSIIRTIDAINTIRVGDYVQFHNEKVGFIKEIIDTESVRIMEASQTSRNRHYIVRKHLCSVIPLAGRDTAKHRSIMQSPSPKKLELESIIDNKTEATKELIAVLQKSREWIYGITKTKHPFYEYLKENEENDKGWIRHSLPKDIEYTDKMLNADM